jgi:hypothetical protein
MIVLIGNFNVISAQDEQYSGLCRKTHWEATLSLISLNRVNIPRQLCKKPATHES